MATSDARAYYDEVECLDREELAALQLQRLQDQVGRLYAGSGFYREKWRSVGFEPGDLKTLADLARLPVTTKQELRHEQAEFPPFGRFGAVDPTEWREVHPSSGTTGVQVRTIWTDADVEAIAAFTARFLWAMGLRGGDVIQNAFSYGLWVAGLAVHYAARRLGCLVVPIGGQPVTQQLRYLHDVGPRGLFATPSFGLFVAETLAREGIDPTSLACAIGAFGGEAGVELGGTRERLETGLGIRAYDIYGLSEVAPTMACECPAQAGLHWAEDHFLVEVLDDNLAPVDEGTPGILVLTHLTKEGTPMIRYATNDVCRYTAAACACGRTHGRSVGGVLGRNDDLIVFRGTKFYPTQVEEVVRALHGFSGEYVIEVRDSATGPAAVEVVAEATDEAVSREVLRKALRAALLVTPAVRIVPPGDLERTEFKAKRVVHRV